MAYFGALSAAAADAEPAERAGTVAGGFVFEAAVVGYDAAGFGASGFLGGAFI